MVRFRLVVDVTFPEADDLPFDQVQAALLSAPNVKCEDVSIREGESLGPEDDYEEWRAGWKRDVAGSLSAGTSFLFGVSYPVPAVEADELARVWEVLVRAERGALRDVNVGVAMGQVLRAESDARSTIVRALMLRALQGRKRLPQDLSREVFERAASVPIGDESGLEALAGIFDDVE
jgi:hypothetical protein